MKMRRPGAKVILLLAATVVACGGLLATDSQGKDRSGKTKISKARINGIKMRIAEQGEGPLVIMLHGFPESWYSWRHQLDALAAAGYHAVAPDMRGYGGTDAPEEVEAYDALDICADVTGLIDHFGEKQAILVGHDWGAAKAWYCAMLEPERFTALINMSVPWGPRGSSPPLASMRQGFGENFFYMIYFQEDAAEEELNADPRGLLVRFMSSPGIPREPATITDPKASAGGLYGRIGVPTELPPWLDEDDLDFYVREFTRTGFLGGLNYYRNLDRDWELTPQLAGAQVQAPVLFIAGEQDLVIRGRDEAALEGPMKAVAPDLKGIHLIPDSGHWIQQERSDQVNGLMLEFLAAVGLPGRGEARTGATKTAGAGGNTGKATATAGDRATAAQAASPGARKTEHGHSGEHGYGRLNPQAPPETSQFAFLVGPWNCKTRFMLPDGSGYGESDATWTGRFILDGWAIQDDWVSVLADGREFHGTNIRSFNPETRKWDNRWLPAGSLQWKYYEAEQKDDTMVMVGGEGTDGRGEFIDRNVFHDISGESWRWRKDRSYDGGETWIEGVGFIEATRAE